jgi:gliding motility-associated lipoprotein GldD
MKTPLAFLFTIACTAVLYSCRPDPVPRPRGYFRIDFPEKTYLPFTPSCPFEMEVPAYARVEINREAANADSCWFNVYFPQYKARLHCTYLPVKNNSDDLVRDAYTFAAKHEMKATAIRRTLIEDTERKVFGVVYDIEGEAASQLQFFVMDSTAHFLRGALYFNSRPNPDSLAPVLAFIRGDVMHMTQTVKWK